MAKQLNYILVLLLLGLIVLGYSVIDRSKTPSTPHQQDFTMATPVFTDQAPAPIGPYSQAVKAGNLVYASGQIGIDPKTGNSTHADVAAETRQVLENLKAVLEAAGSSLQQVVKTTVFLKDLNDFEAMNQVYAVYFGDHKPARACIEVARLPKDMRVEIEAVSVIGS